MLVFVSLTDLIGFSHWIAELLRQIRQLMDLDLQPSNN
jgi:hypothetical protein